MHGGGSLHVNAATLQTVGARSAVASVDLAAAFDTLNAATVVHLETFAEGEEKLTTSADSCAADFAMAVLLDPFHGAKGADRAFDAISSGNNDGVSIETTNRTRMYGFEFMYGNAWTAGDFSTSLGKSRRADRLADLEGRRARFLQQHRTHPNKLIPLPEGVIGRTDRAKSLPTL